MLIVEHVEEEQHMASRPNPRKPFVPHSTGESTKTRKHVVAFGDGDFRPDYPEHRLMITIHQKENLRA